MTRHLPALLLLVVASSGAALAQPEADPAADAADPAAQGDTAAPAPPRAEDTRAADDYEASEQISEDLSVSFPVDI